MRRAEDRRGNDEDDDATWPVVAHGLVGSLAIVQGAAETLRDSWERLDDASRRRLVEIIADQAVLVGGVLRDVTTRAPAASTTALDRLRLRSVRGGS